MNNNFIRQGQLCLLYLANVTYCYLNVRILQMPKYLIWLFQSCSQTLKTGDISGITLWQPQQEDTAFNGLSLQRQNNGLVAILVVRKLYSLNLCPFSSDIQ